MGIYSLMGMEFQLYKMKRDLKMSGGGVCTTI